MLVGSLDRPVFGEDDAEAVGGRIDGNLVVSAGDTGDLKSGVCEKGEGASIKEAVPPAEEDDTDPGGGPTAD